MRQRTRKCAIMFILPVVMTLFAGQALAVKYYHISRPKLGFELSYEFNRDKRRGPFVDRVDESTRYSERLDIETDGWFYHPALVEYVLTLSPEWEQTYEDPDDSEMRKKRSMLRGYNAEFVFLQYKPYTLTLFGNKTQSTLSSNFARTSKTKSENSGVRLDLKYSTLPTVLEYTHYKDRRSGFYTSTSEKDEIRLNSRFDRALGDTRLDMTYIDLSDSSNFTTINSISKEATLQNIYRFYGKGNISLTSFIGYRDKQNNYFLEKGVSLYENIFWSHRKNLSTNYNARFESFDMLDNKRREFHSFDFKLNHLLYENLITSVNIDTSKNHDESGQERVHGAGLDWNYSRRIPGGTLNVNIGHAYRVYDKRPNMHIFAIDVRDEVIILNSNTLTFLANKHVETGSIAVYEKKPDGTRGIRYTENSDYIITVIGDYTGISLTVTSAISDGAEVLVDYKYVSEPPFDYSVFDRTYGIALSLWNSFKVYFNFIRSKQGFLRGVKPENLRTYVSRTSSIEYKWKWSSTTFEYIDISSTEIPTESWSATEALTFRPTNKVYLTFSSSFGATRFKKLTTSNDTDRYQNYKAGMQVLLPRKGILNLDSFLNKTSGVINKTRDFGFSSMFEWNFNIYNGYIKYQFSDEKDKTSHETFKNHLFMLTIKRELF